MGFFNDLLGLVNPNPDGMSGYKNLTPEEIKAKIDAYHNDFKNIIKNDDCSAQAISKADYFANEIERLGGRLNRNERNYVKQVIGKQHSK